MKQVVFFLIIVLLSSCEKSKEYRSIDNIHGIVENRIYNFIDEEKIYEIMVSFGYFDNMRNITSLDIQIIFNLGYWKNTDSFNDDIEKEIRDELYKTFSNKNEKYLEIEDVEIKTYHQFIVNFPTERIYSESEKENISESLEEEFELEFIAQIYENYCEGFIDDSIDFDSFSLFMEKCFGNDIIIEL